MRYVGSWYRCERYSYCILAREFNLSGCTNFLEKYKTGVSSTLNQEEENDDEQRE